MRFAGSAASGAAVEGLIEVLERGIDTIRKLDDVDYALGRHGASSIGAHFRHNLDFVNALLNGLAERRIDYTARPRDARVECDREYASEQLSFACRRLKALTTSILARLVMIRSEIHEDIWHASSVSREIEFLHSHTVHHYALIAKLITEAGREVSDEFGVAPSTLRFRSGAENYRITELRN